MFFFITAQGNIYLWREKFKTNYYSSSFLSKKKKIQMIKKILVKVPETDIKKEEKACWAGVCGAFEYTI